MDKEKEIYFTDDFKAVRDEFNRKLDEFNRKLRKY